MAAEFEDLDSLPLYFKSGIGSGNRKFRKKHVATKYQGFRQDLKQDLEGPCAVFHCFVDQDPFKISMISN